MRRAARPGVRGLARPSMPGEGEMWAGTPVEGAQGAEEGREPQEWGLWGTGSFLCCCCF